MPSSLDDDSPSGRRRSGLGSLFVNAASAISRTAEAAGTLLVDGDLRRKGAKAIAGGASKGIGVIHQGLQNGANTIHRGFQTVQQGPRQLQSVLQRLSQQIEEQRMRALLAEQRDAPTDVQVGFQLFEDSAQELRSRLWMALLEHPELVGRYHAVHRENEAGGASVCNTPTQHAPCDTRYTYTDDTRDDIDAEERDWEVVGDRGAQRWMQGRSLLSGGALHRSEPWTPDRENYRQDLMIAMSAISWPLPSTYPAECKYATLLQISIGQEEVDDVISRDIHRTFPEYPLFGFEQGQQALFRVLKAYSLHDLEVGYCQGMAFVAGLALFFVPEEPAFQILCRLLAETGPNLRGYYLPDLKGLKTALRAFDILLGRYLPNLKAHLEATGAVVVLFASQWFLSAFSCPFPVGFACRLIDVMLVENSANILQRAAMAVMAEFEAALLVQEDFEELLTCLKVEPVQWETHRLRRVLNAAIHDSPISDEELKEVMDLAESDEQPLIAGLAGRGGTVTETSEERGPGDSGTPDALEKQQQQQQGDTADGCSTSRRHASRTASPIKATLPSADGEVGEEGPGEDNDVDAALAAHQAELETAYVQMVLDLDHLWGDDSEHVEEEEGGRSLPGPGTD